MTENPQRSEWIEHSKGDQYSALRLNILFLAMCYAVSHCYTVLCSWLFCALVYPSRCIYTFFGYMKFHWLWRCTFWLCFFAKACSFLAVRVFGPAYSTALLGWWTVFAVGCDVFFQCFTVQFCFCMVKWYNYQVFFFFKSPSVVSGSGFCASMCYWLWLVSISLLMSGGERFFLLAVTLSTATLMPPIRG